MVQLYGSDELKSLKGLFCGRNEKWMKEHNCPGLDTC